MTTNETLATMSIDRLIAEWKKFNDWIHSSDNDGRLTTGSSAQLDYSCDMLDEIEEELKRRDARWRKAIVDVADRQMAEMDWCPFCEKHEHGENDPCIAREAARL